MIEIKNIYAGYKKREVLSGISLTIKDGSFNALLGKNASGKTTLLKAVCRLIKLDGGSILINGQNIENISYKNFAKTLSFTPQNFNAAFNFNVKDFLMMARFWSVGYFKTASKIDMQKIDEAIDFMAIGDIANRNILELSGGQFQRVLIAQNIVQDSSILIFDEPISHLDIDAQGFIMERLKYLNMHFNKTIILTAHEINMPLEFCQNIILIDEGKIVAEEDGNSNKLISSIEKIYKTKFHIGRNPHSNRPYVIAVNSSK